MITARVLRFGLSCTSFPVGHHQFLHHFKIFPALRRSYFDLCLFLSSPHSLPGWKTPSAATHGGHIHLLERFRKLVDPLKGIQERELLQVPSTNIYTQRGSQKSSTYDASVHETPTSSTENVGLLVHSLLPAMQPSACCRTKREKIFSNADRRTSPSTKATTCGCLDDCQGVRGTFSRACMII